MYEIIWTLAIFVVTLFIVLNWQKKNYWRTRGISGPSSYPFIGHFLELSVGQKWKALDKHYYEYKKQGIWGMYESIFHPVLFVADSSLLRDIMVKEADSFIDTRPMNFSKHDEYFNEMLFFLRGWKWKSLRSIMTPVFSSGKLKAMMPIVSSKTEDFLNECKVDMGKKSFVEIKSLYGYLILDIIASCSFGLDAKCLQQKEESMFVEASRSIFVLNIFTMLKFMSVSIAPRLSELLGVKCSGDVSFFTEVFEKTIEHKESTGVRRGDFLDLLLDVYEEQKVNPESSKYPMTKKTMMAGSLVFLTAGFEGTSNTMAITTDLMAEHLDIQKRLREELENIMERDGKFDYQNVMEAPYLEAVISESMRLYPPAYFTERCCTKDFQIPGSKVIIPEKTIVGVPIWSFHRDPEYWKDPHEYQPERFLQENKAKIKPYTYLPFGLGPRNCIAMRFAYVVVKMILAKMVYNFEISRKPGFDGIQFDNSAVGLLRPDQNGVQVVLKPIQRK